MTGTAPVLLRQLMSRTAPSKAQFRDYEMRIVLIEDDRQLLRSLETILKDQGHSVMSFHNPEAAIFFLNLRPIMNVLVVDYQLKTLTAKYLLERLKNVLPKKCKVILISGYEDVVHNLNFKAMGIYTFLPKPLDLEKLLFLIGKINKSR